MLKKLLVLVLILFVFSCKNDKAKSNSSEETTKSLTEKKPEILNKLILPSHKLWAFNRLSFEEDTSNNERLDAFKVARTSLDQTAYAVVKDIPIIYGSKYKLSILAKKGDLGFLFGFRAIGEYPNRIDAVFDLKNGLVKDNKSSGEFIEGEATIEPLEDGWFKCSIISELDADMIKLIFGPTSGLGKTIAWEAQTKDLCDTYIIPSSLTLQEISN